MFSVTTSWSYETVKVADGIIAHVMPEYHGAVVSGNSVAVTGDDSVLVVDSGHFPSLTRRVIDEIQTTSKKPVRFLVNTHWHPDHWMGNSLYREAFPNVAILSHVFTRKMIEKTMMDYPKKASEQIRQYLNDLKESLRTGKTKDGKILTEEDKRFRTDFAIPDLEQFEPEVSNMKVQPPTLTFEHGVTVDLGGREVRIMHLGRGNTPDDVVVHVPDSEVSVTGDLVVAPTPYAFGSYLTEWIDTLTKLKKIGGE